MDALIERYKKFRKKGQLTKKYKGKYAFVGIGNHSINNLYPVLNYLNVDLKYIIVKSEETAQLLRANYADIIVSTNIDDALNDIDIVGVLASTNPKSHFEIAKKALLKNKHVFIEKPPCTTLNELNELKALEKKSKGTVLVGLQRRYSPAYNILKKKLTKCSNYSLQHKTGAYPEGNELYDLFIHPLDAAYYLFGDGEVKNVNIIKKNNTIIYLGQIAHINGVFGTFEFSTDHSWGEAIDQFVINSDNGEYSTINTSEVNFTNKPKTILGIPIEKIGVYTPQQSKLYHQNSFLPVKEHNQLYTAGYFNEIDSFLSICEGLSTENKSSLTALTNTFKSLEILAQQKG